MAFNQIRRYFTYFYQIVLLPQRKSNTDYKKELVNLSFISGQS